MSIITDQEKIKQLFNHCYSKRFKMIKPDIARVNSFYGYWKKNGFLKIKQFTKLRELDNIQKYRFN